MNVQGPHSTAKRPHGTPRHVSKASEPLFTRGSCYSLVAVVNCATSRQELAEIWVLARRIHPVYIRSGERSPDPARPARTGAEPRIRPQARLRRLLRARQ